MPNGVSRRPRKEGERLHNEMNMIERTYLNIRNKSMRYYHMLKEYNNKLGLPMEIFDVSKRNMKKILKKKKKIQKQTILGKNEFTYFRFTPGICHVMIQSV